MTAPDLTRIAGLLLTKALKRLPELTHHGEQWSLSDEGGPHAILWRWDGSEWTVAARMSLTVEVQPISTVVVGGVVDTGEEGVTA